MNLHIKFDQFVIPEDAKASFSITETLQNIKYSSKFKKLLVFLKDNVIDNDVIDYYMGIKPERQENEDYYNYKCRLKFQKILLKYRSFLYDYENNS